MELPAHRKLTLATIFQDLENRRRISKKTWERYLGQLRFVSVAIPGSAGLFSALQLALNRSCGNRIRINKSLSQHLHTFAALTASLSHRPTHLAEVVPQIPSLVGTTDAAKAGMGGVYFDAHGQGYVWLHPFPKEVQSRLVSTENPAGTVTNSDLEQAGLLAQVSLMACQQDLRYTTVSNASDNTPAVARINKGAVSSDGPAAHLCNYACAHQRQHRYCHLAAFLPGQDNVMADDASRLQALTDSEFLAHFEQKYPQPKPWKLLHLPSNIASLLTSALLSKSPPMPTPPNDAEPPANCSASGTISAPLTATPALSILSHLKKDSPTCLSSPSDTDKAGKRVALSGLAQYVMPSPPLPRGSPTWVNRIPASKTVPGNSIPYYLLSSTARNEQMSLRPEHTRSTSPSCRDSPKPWTFNTRNWDICNSTPFYSPPSPSSGYFGPPSTSTLQTPLNPEAKPSASAMSPSPSTEKSTPPSTHL
jgi:hypothetical protein